MADKFPALDTIDNDLVAENSEADSDFLSREKELLGNEFQTDQDKEILNDEDEDEISEFKEQFPEVESSTQDLQDELPQEEEEEEEFNDFSSSGVKNEGESIHLKEWKVRRELEISEREKANKKKKEEIISKARQTIDDFYENYNNKKDQHYAEVMKEQEEFLSKKDNFLKRGTLWSRVVEIVDEAGETADVEGRDKTRFRKLLDSLKTKENAPGAGGY